MYLNISISNSITEMFSGRNNGEILVMQSFFDESGTHKGSELLCVAGYLGKKNQWLEFIKEWHKLLIYYNIDCFHAKDPSCNIMKADAVNTILSHDFKGIVVSVNPNIYNFYKEKIPLGNSYSACAFLCGIEIQRWNKERVAIIFEAGQPNINYIIRVFDKLIDHPDYPIISVGKGSKREYLPLQAADFLAHSFTTNQEDYLNKLNTKNNISFLHVDSTTMEKIAKESKNLIKYERHKRRQERKINRNGNT